MVLSDCEVDLSKEVQKVLQDVAIDYRDRLANIAMERAESSRAAYIKAGGTIMALSSEDRQLWVEAIPDIAAQWAEDLEKRGEPGTEMLKAYLAKLQAAGYTGLRDWSAGLK